MTLLSFYNDITVKEKYLARLAHHEEADNIIQGTGWENGKGCAIGCTLESYNHAAYETELGLPEWLARLEDEIFEKIPNAEAKKFPRELLEAVPVGVNLDPVRWKFCLFLLDENYRRVEGLKISDRLKTDVLTVIDKVKVLHITAIETGVWDSSAAESAWSAAESAAFIRYKDKLLELLREAGKQ